MPVITDEVATVRSFNRFYTGVIGVLGEGHLDTPYSLTEARVIFELAQRDTTEVLELRRSLGLDAGYLSRMLARFESDGVVARERAAGDARRQVVRLTPHGREVFAMLDQRSVGEIEAMLERLPDDDRRRLVGAMKTIRGVLAEDAAPRPAFTLRALRPGDLGWVVQRNGALYAEEVGWDRTYEALVASIVAGYGESHDPERENAWIAEVDGAPVGSVFCMQKDETVAQLRLLIVEPSTRGLGVGAALVGECVRFAEQAGYAEMMLWTTALQESAHRLYQAVGFELETEEAPVERFGGVIHGQYWRKKF